MQGWPREHRRHCLPRGKAKLSARCKRPEGSQVSTRARERRERYFVPAFVSPHLHALKFTQARKAPSVLTDIRHAGPIGAAHHCSRATCHDMASNEATRTLGEPGLIQEHPDRKSCLAILD